MKKDLFFRLCIITILFVAILACSSITGTGSTSPYLTPTAGEWSGQNGGFTLLESGELSNFHWVLNAKEIEQSRCPIGLNENLPMTDGVADITFTKKDTGEVSFNLKIIFNSATTATLTYQYDFCPSTRSIAFSPDGGVITYTGEDALELINP